MLASVPPYRPIHRRPLRLVAIATSAAALAVVVSFAAEAQRPAGPDADRPADRRVDRPADRPHPIVGTWVESGMRYTFDRRGFVTIERADGQGTPYHAPYVTRGEELVIQPDGPAPWRNRFLVDRDRMDLFLLDEAGRVTSPRHVFRRVPQASLAGRYRGVFAGSGTRLRLTFERGELDGVIEFADRRYVLVATWDGFADRVAAKLVDTDRRTYLACTIHRDGADAVRVVVPTPGHGTGEPAQAVFRFTRAATPAGPLGAPPTR